jgi:hypothetical protein
VLRVITPADPTLLAEPAVCRSFRDVDVPLADPSSCGRDVASGPGADAQEAADALLAALPRELVCSGGACGLSMPCHSVR